MIYRAMGVLCSASETFIAFAEFHENAGSWSYELKASGDYPAGTIHVTIGQFMDTHDLEYRVALVTTHTDSSAIINGASIAAVTGLPVITDLPGVDIELGGNGQFYSTIAKKLFIEETDLDVLKKTLCVAFMGILRWREEYNFLSSITGASRDSIGGAVWLGQEA